MKFNPYHPFHLLSPSARVGFHVIATYAWLATMVFVPFLPTFQGHANLAALLIMEVSLYANFATEFGSIDAARAASQTEMPHGYDKSL